MKTKKLMLGSLVFVFAIGSAIASAFALQTVHVRAILTDSSEVCVELDAQCEDTGQFACTVQVPVVQGPNTTSNVYSDAGCMVQLLSNDSSPVIPTEPADEDIQIFELLEP